MRRCAMSTTHAFADHIGLRIVESRPGHSICTVTIAAHHLNPHGVVHGAVLFALADTGMGAAVYPQLRPDQSCTTISAQIGYLAAARAGELRCETSVVRLGRTVAHLESRVMCDGQPVATASGQYAITARPPP